MQLSSEIWSVTCAVYVCVCVFSLQPLHSHDCTCTFRSFQQKERILEKAKKTHKQRVEVS